MIGFDYQCAFDIGACMDRLGINEYGRVQKAIDSSFLMGVEPFVPMDMGLLIDSGWTHTDIGSGEIVWDAENKARRLYYGEKKWKWSNGGVQEGGLRGPYWAERYIQDGGAEQIETVAREAVRK